MAYSSFRKKSPQSTKPVKQLDTIESFDDDLRKKFTFSRTTLRWIILVSCVVALALSLLIVIFGARNTLSKTCQNVTEDFTSIMKSYEHSFCLFEVILQREIANAESIEEIESFLKTQDSNLLAIEGGDYDGIYMYYKGEYLYSWDTPSSVYIETGYDATTRPWYIGAVNAKGKVFFSTPYPSYANDYMLATISRLQEDNETVIAYDIKLGEISRFVNKLDIYHGALALICDNQGNVIGSTEHLYLGGNYTASVEELDRKISDAQAELNAASDPKNIANAEKKLESANALKEYGVNKFAFLNKLFDKKGNLLFSPSFTFGYAYGNEEYIVFVTAPAVELFPQIILFWAALSFGIILLACLVLNMILKSRQILTDVLTGLNNRRAFLYYCGNHVHRHKDETLGLLILDLNYFKSINDTYGHLVGDNALRDTALMLKSVCSTFDNCFICRYGGDEFLIALSKCQPEDLGRLTQAIAEAFKTNNTKNKPYKLDASMGTAFGVCPDKKSLETLIAEADNIMYIKKESLEKT